MVEVGVGVGVGVVVEVGVVVGIGVVVVVGIGVGEKLMDYFKIASECCRKDAERIRRQQAGILNPLGYVPLARAAICLDCEAVFVIGNTCPNCASTGVMTLATWLFSTLAPP